MTYQLLAAGISIGIAASGGAIGIGLLSGKALDAMARQPEQQNNLRATMILAIAFVEACVLYALVISFIILAR